MASPAELARLARAGKQLRPVFIVGEARSGTTLLFRLLQQQPAFGPEPPQLAESAFMQALLTVPDLESQQCWRLRNFLMDDPDAWSRFKARAAPLLAVRRVALRRRPGAYADIRTGRVLGAAGLARVYLAHAAEVRRVNRLVEKTPSAAAYSGHLLAWFPGCRVLYIHRHPVDVLSSFWRRAQVDKRREQWGAITVEEFAADYAQRSRSALEWSRRRPDAVRLLRYEDLVTDPVATIGDLCVFAGAGFDPAAVAATDYKRPTPDALTWEEVTPQSKQWRDFMTEEQAADLESRLASVLDALGHSRYMTAA